MPLIKTLNQQSRNSLLFSSLLLIITHHFLHPVLCTSIVISNFLYPSSIAVYLTRVSLSIFLIFLLTTLIAGYFIFCSAFMLDFFFLLLAWIVVFLLLNFVVRFFPFPRSSLPIFSFTSLAKFLLLGFLHGLDSFHRPS